MLGSVQYSIALGATATGKTTTYNIIYTYIIIRFPFYSYSKMSTRTTTWYSSFLPSSGQTSSFLSQPTTMSSLLLAFGLILVIIVITLLVVLPMLRKRDSSYENAPETKPNQPTPVDPLDPEVRNAIMANIVDSSLFGYNIGQVSEVPIYNLQAMRNYINSDSRAQKLGKHSKIDSNYQLLVSGKPIASLGTGKDLNDELYEYINAMYYGIHLQSKHPQWRRAANLQAPNAAISNENQGNQNLGESDLYPDKLDGDLNNPVHLETISNSRKRRALIEPFAESDTNAPTKATSTTDTNKDIENREMYELTRIISVVEAVLQSVTNVTSGYAVDDKYYTTQSMVYLCHLYALYLLSYDPLYYREILDAVSTSTEAPAPAVTNIIERWSYNPLAILHGLYNGQTYSAIAKNAEHQGLILALNRNQTVQPYESVEGFSVDNVYLKGGLPRMDLIALGLDNFFVHHFHRANRVARAYRTVLPYRRFNYACSAILHNKSDFAAPGFFGDAIELKHDFSTKYSTLYPGLASLPSLAFLRFYTDNWVFAKRGFKLGQIRVATIDATTDRKRNLIANCIFRPIAISNKTAESIKIDQPQYGMIVDTRPEPEAPDADTSTQKAYSLVYQNYGFLYSKGKSISNKGVVREDIWVCDSEKMLIRHVFRVTNATDGTANIANAVLYHYPAIDTNINVVSDKLVKLTLDTAPSFSVETIFNLATGKAKSTVLAAKDITLQFAQPFALTTSSVKTADEYNASSHVVVEATRNDKEVVGIYTRSDYKNVTDGGKNPGFKVLTLINVSYKWPVVLAVSLSANDTTAKYYRLDPRNFYQYTPVLVNE